MIHESHIDAISTKGINYIKDGYKYAIDSELVKFFDKLNNHLVPKGTQGGLRRKEVS